MQPSPPFAAPPRRGPVVAIVLLATGLVASTTIAVVEFVQLREARQRIEELEAQADGAGAGGLFGELGEILEDTLGDLGGSLGDLGGTADLFGCLSSGQSVSAPSIGELPVQQQVDAIAGQVEQLRGLDFTESVAPEFVDPAESSRRVRELFLEEYTGAMGDAEERMLTALGAIPPGTDVRQLRTEILGQQVAGYYDPETGELVVRRGGPSLTVGDRVVLAHELDHVLTDQALGLPIPDDIRSGPVDQDLAATALVEGDATLVMQRYSLSLPLDEQLQGLDPAAITEAIQAQSALTDVPPYLRRELTFPYEQGLAFVCDLYAEGGWAAVNDVYRDPPDSTVEILRPDLYREGFEPADPRDIGVRALLGTWRNVSVQQFGAAQLSWLFAAPGGDPGRALSEPDVRAEAWGGGELRLWASSGDTALNLSLVDREGGNDLCGSVVEWYRRAFEDDRERREGGYELVSDGPQQDALIVCTDGWVRVGIAPSLGAAAGLVR